MSIELYDQYFESSSQVLLNLKRESERISELTQNMIKSLTNKGTILWCGNGGSASDSQHLAAELVGRFEKNRPALSSVALTTDTSIITAIANDFQFEDIFSRQVEALGRKGDVLVGITTSGESSNVLSALKVAKNMGITTSLLTSDKYAKNPEFIDHVIRVPSTRTCHIQEGHIAIGQAICSSIESHFFP
jgi:D-sedoheptulose 7-phosphate isomerase